MIPHRALGTSPGCCYAPLAPEGENHAFSNDFEGFPENVRFPGPRLPGPSDSDAETSRFSTVLHVVFLGTGMLFFLAGWPEPP